MKRQIVRQLQIICDDVIHWAKTYQGEPFAAILTDPPYHLHNGGKGGFMGKEWDGLNNIAFQPETWAALAEHLLPGGFIMAFASSRGWHRLACAMEDAGLIIQPSIFGWLNAQAFPKATRVDSQLDKWKRRDYVKAAIDLGLNIPGRNYDDWTKEDHVPSDKWWKKFKEVLSSEDWQAIERKVVGKSGWSHQVGIPLPNTYNGQRQYLDITAPATDLARAWEGHRYGGQILKNALEPIIVAQKPWEGKRLDCIVETGAGSLWVDGGRIGTAEDTGRISGPRALMGGLQDKETGRFETQGHPQGRWPSNFVLCHSEGCERVGVKRVKGITGGEGETTQSIGGRNAYQGGDNRGFFNYADPDGLESVDDWRCIEDCPVRKLDEQAGERKSGGGNGNRHAKGPAYGDVCYGAFSAKKTEDGIAPSSGGASRFFFQADWQHEVAERIAAADPVRYCPKASRTERDQGLDGFIIGPRHTLSGGECIAEGRTASKGKANGRNPHPTVKPISLLKWLATLLLPPDEYAPRRIMIPFAGSGSEMIAAGLAGWEEIIGIEMEQEYCGIAEARLEHWLNERQLELL